MSFDDMDPVELRHEYEAALETACRLGRQIADAWEANDLVWAAGLMVVFREADARVKRLKRMLVVEA